MSCIELPCPKTGSAYVTGLEHAEFVIGSAEDGCVNTHALSKFVADCEADQTIQLEFDRAAMKKQFNADVQVRFPHEGERGINGDFSCKFHQRPLYEVIAFEIAQGEVVEVPAGYFNQTGTSRL